jgi:AcrR family transcriptional regulator
MVQPRKLQCEPTLGFAENMSGDSHCQGDTLSRRRTPQQQRGVQTLDALLAATAALIDEVGYPSVTTKAIAARAGTSIGAFYQFFANKDAAVAELAQRYRSQVREYLASTVGARGLPPTWVEDTILGLAQIYRNMPGFRGVWLGRHQLGPLGEQARALRAEVHAALDEALGTAYPDVAAAARRRCLTIALETAYLLLSNVTDKQLAFGELQRMLGLYLGSYFPVKAARSGR